MSEPIPILHIEPDPQTAEFIQHTLEQGEYLVTSVQSGKEGLISAWRDQPEVIICELDLPDIDGGELVQKLRNDQRTRKTMIIALTSRRNPASAVEAKESGVDRYFVKQPGAVDMLVDYLVSGEDAIREHSHATGSSSHGSITSLIGIKGGSGASSLALNLAHLLGTTLGEGRVLVVDFDLPMGSLATISGVRGKLTLDQLLAQEPQALANMALHEKVLIPQAWSCAVLAGLKHPEPLNDWSSSNIPALLQALRDRYEHIVIDLGRDLSPPGRAVLAQSDHVLLILQPDEECVGRAKSVFSYLRKIGTDRDKIHFITNRPLPSESLTLRSTEQALGHTILGAVPYMGDEVTLVNRLHAPIAMRFPESRGNIVLTEIAATMLGEKNTGARKERISVRS